MCFPPVREITELDHCTQVLKNLKGVSIASLNVRSLIRKLDDVKTLLHRSNLDILCYCSLC